MPFQPTLKGNPNLLGYIQDDEPDLDRKVSDARIEPGKGLHLSLKQSKNAAGAAGGAGYLGAAHDQRRAPGWQLTEVGGTLQAPAVAAQPARMHREIGGKASVEAQGVHDNAFYIALSKEEFDGFDVKARGAEGAVAGGVAKLCGMHVRIPTAAHGHNAAGGQTTVLGFPGSQVIESQLRVGICRGFAANVHYGQRSDQVGGRNEVRRVLVRAVQRGVKVGAGVFMDMPAVYVPRVVWPGGHPFHG